MTAAVVPSAAWERALDGIAILGRKIDALAEEQRALQEQLTNVRSAYTRAAPMAIVEQLEGRVLALESGATAAILTRLDADVTERGARRADTDRRDRWMTWALLGLALAVLILVAVLLWLARGGLL